MKHADSADSSLIMPCRSPATEKTPILYKSFTNLHDNQDGAERGDTSWPMGSLILLNAIVGAGILTLPYSVLHSGGFAIGLTIEIMMGLIAWGSIILLGWLAAKKTDTRIRSFQDIAYAYLGNIGGVVTSLLICIFYFLICTSYLVAVRDQLQDIINNNISHHTAERWFMNSKFLVFVITLITIAPWCFVKKIDTLKYISTLASVCIIYLVGLIVAAQYSYKLHAPFLKHQQIPAHDTTSLVQAIFYGCPTFTIAYFFHPPSVLVYDSLNPRTYSGYLKTTGLTLSVTMVVYTLLAVFAVLTFGNNLNEHILLNFNSAEPSVIAGSVFYMVKLVLEYPVCYLAAREGVMSIIRLFVLSMEPGTKKDHIMKIMFAAIYLIITLIIAVLVPSLIAIMQFAGIFVLPLVTIIPGSCLIKKLRNSDQYEGEYRGIRRVLLWILGVFCIIFGVFLIILAIIQSVDNVTKS